MPKIVRSFNTKTEAQKWVADMKKIYQGKVVGGSTYSTDRRRMRAYIFGDITEDMAAEIRSRQKGNGYFEYKK